MVNDLVTINKNFPWFIMEWDPEFEATESINTLIVMACAALRQ